MSQFTLATSTAVHGLKLVVSTAPPFGKLFWSLIFCFSLGGLGFSFYNIIAQYLSFPVVVLTSISANEMPFPTVTVCNTNPYKKSMLQRSITMQNLFSTYQVMTDTSVPRTKRSIIDNNDHLKAKISPIHSSTTDIIAEENDSKNSGNEGRRKRQATTDITTTDPATTISGIVTTVSGPGFCPPISLFNGTIDYGGVLPMANGNYPAGTTATYAPPFGYYLSTLELLTTTTCGNDGLWSVPPPDCILGCLILACFKNGYLSYKPAVLDPVQIVNGTITFNCNIGYYLSSLEQTTVGSCQSSGSWNATPSCLRVCDQNIRIPYADVPVFTPPNLMNGGYQAAVTANFTCWPSYTLSGTAAVCEPNGTWSNIPQCTKPPPADPGCDPQITFPSGGSVNFSRTITGYSKYQTGDTAVLSCATGYYRSSLLPITCNESGLWENVPECIRGCEDGFCFMYGDVGFTPSIYMDGMHPLGTTVIYFCVQGFYLLEEKLENTTAVCDPTGYWTSQPNCAAGCFNHTLVNGNVYYEGLKIVNNVHQRYEVITFTCNDGYYLSTEEVNTTGSCVPKGSSASWKPIPTCLIGCNNVSIDNGTVVLPLPTLNGVYIQMKLATFTCFDGFYLSTLKVTSTAFCDTTGSWTSVPKCLLGCTPMPSIINGQTVYSRATVNSLYPQTTVATFTCNSGYYLSTNQTSTTTTCSQYGQFWNFTQTPECLPGCDDISLSNGWATYSPSTTINGVYPPGTSATFYCPGGSDLSDNTTLLSTCTPARNWTTIPVCLNVTSCPPYFPPVGGTSSGGFYNASGVVRGPIAGTVIIITCLPGYGMNGTGTATCRNDSTWSTTDTSCFPLLPFNITLHSVNELLQYLNTTITNDFMSLTSGFQDFLPYLLSDLSDSNRSYLGYTKDDMFVACFYNNRPCDMEKDVTLLVDQTYGNCYSFNGGKNASISTSNRAGTSHGVAMILDAMQGEYPDWLTAVGMKIVIHNANDTIFPDSMGYAITPGYQTVLSVKKDQFEKINKPDEKCISTPNATSYFFYSDDYLPEGCMRSFVQTVLLKICKCGYVKYGLPPNNISFCGPEKRECLNNYLASDEGQRAVANASAYCNNQCEKREFDATISISRMSAHARIRCDTIKKPNCDDNAIMSNLAYIQIYFDSMTVLTLAEDPAYAVGNVVSDTGGQMGIWLGMSIVSFVEISCLILTFVVKLFCPSTSS